MADDPLREAAAQIAQSPALRALVRHMYEFCGMASDPFTANALTTAHNSGKMAAMVELSSILTYHEPALLPRILLEINNERSRDADAARESAGARRADDDPDD